MSYNEFMEKYQEEHYMCPQCHTRNFSQTCVAYVFDELHPEEYQDRNGVECLTCGWHGSVHKLIHKPEKTAFQVALFNHGKIINYDSTLRNHDDAKELVNKLSKESSDFYYCYEVEIKD